MAYVLLPEFLERLVDSSGNPYSGAKINVYLSGGTTPSNSYQTSAGTAHANPVVSDSAGLFAPIFLDPAIAAYRLKVTTSGGTTIQDIDPYVPSTAITEAAGADITAGTSATTYVSPRRLGALGVNLTALLALAGGILTGRTQLSFTPTTLGDNDLGFRNVKLTTTDSSSTLALVDAGRGWLHTSGSAHNWTIPPNSSVAYPVGTTIVLANTGAGVVSLLRGSGVALRIAGSATDGTKSFAQYGIATLFQVATDSWYVSGTCLS